MTAKITGTGSAVPIRRVSNEELSKMVDTSDAWIFSRTGIKERRIAEAETTASLAAEAAKRALENAQLSGEDIELLIVATCSPDFFFPSTACRVQEAIHAKGAAAFDLSAACSGFLFALNTAKVYLESGAYRRALVIGAETLSRLLDWTDRSTCVLFGDGAGAVVLEASEKGLIDMVQYSDGAQGHVLTCKARAAGSFPAPKEQEPDWLRMEGQEVFRFAVKKVPECIGQLLEKNNVQKEEIRYYILHQANSRIIAGAAKRLREPEEKFPMNMERYGNTSAASIPVLLDELNREGKLKPGDKLVLSGFGAGLTWGAALMEWQ